MSESPRLTETQREARARARELHGKLPWEVDGSLSPGEIPGDERMQAYADELGVTMRVPEGARKLGCVECQRSEVLRHPDGGPFYCACCPVRRRQTERKVTR